MPRRVPLPPALRAAAFRPRDSGLGEGRLRGADLARPFHGTRSSAPLDFEQVCRCYVPLMGPTHHFSHLTAARLWGCPVPDSPAADDAIHVSVTPPIRAPRGRGVIGHQVSDPHVVVRRDLRVSDPASTWIALARILPLDELVACGDHLVLSPHVLDPRDPRPYVRIAELQARVRNYHGRGARAAASAIRLVRTGAESRPETLLRLLLMRHGLPEPEINTDIADARGRWIGRGDLVYRAWRTIVEYDGDGHRTSTAQYERDVTRIEDFMLADWSVIRVRSRGLFVAPEQTVARVRRVLEQRGWVSN